MEPNNQNDTIGHLVKTSARDFFVHLSSQVALYAIVINLVNLLFTIINKVYPKVNSGYYYYGNSSSTISFPVALIIIVFPIFVFLMWYLEKTYLNEPEKKYLPIRKWLTYITIFVSGFILAADLVTVLYYFLDGQELTIGFLLKILTLFLISGAVFLYYLSDIREKLTNSTKKASLVIGLILIIVSIILGFAVIGSPRTQRLVKYDQQKVNDITNINNQIVNYFYNKKTLPENLNDLTKDITYYTSPVDPQNKGPYEYKKTGSIIYELCANFNFDFDKNREKTYYSDGIYPMVASSPSYYPGYEGYRNKESSWEYKAGKFCFQRTIEKIDMPLPMTEVKSVY